jgi:hypothetical protein
MDCLSRSSDDVVIGPLGRWGKVLWSEGERLQSRQVCDFSWGFGDAAEVGSHPYLTFDRSAQGGREGSTAWIWVSETACMW